MLSLYMYRGSIQSTTGADQGHLHRCPAGAEDEGRQCLQRHGRLARGTIPEGNGKVRLGEGT